MFNKIFPKLHAEGYKFIVIAFVLTIILYNLSNFFGLVGIVSTIWVYYFFRDPERVIIEDDNYLVSPADGEVIKVEEANGPEELGLEKKTLPLHKFRSPQVRQDVGEGDQVEHQHVGPLHEDLPPPVLRLQADEEVAVAPQVVPRHPVEGRDLSRCPTVDGINVAPL